MSAWSTGDVAVEQAPTWQAGQREGAFKGAEREAGVASEVSQFKRWTFPCSGDLRFISHMTTPRLMAVHVEWALDSVITVP